MKLSKPIEYPKDDMLASFIPIWQFGMGLRPYPHAFGLHWPCSQMRQGKALIPSNNVKWRQNFESMRVYICVYVFVYLCVCVDQV